MQRYDLKRGVISTFVIMISMYKVAIYTVTPINAFLKSWDSISRIMEFNLPWLC